MFVLAVICFVFSWDDFFVSFLVGYGIMFIIFGILSKVSIRKYPILRKFFVSGKFKK